MTNRKSLKIKRENLFLEDAAYWLEVCAADLGNWTHSSQMVRVKWFASQTLDFTFESHFIVNESSMFTVLELAAALAEISALAAPRKAAPRKALFFVDLFKN